MDPPLDIASLSPQAQKILDPSSPAPLRQMAARGIAPGIRPGDAVTILCVLAEAPDASIASTARGTLDKLPAPVLNGALAADLPAGVIDVLAPLYAKNVSVMEKMLALPSITMETVARVAAAASEMVAELVATNEERLLKNPAIIEKLYMNKATRMSTADRVLELAVRNNIELTGIPAFKEAAAAIKNELIFEPSAEPTPDDLRFKEVDQLSEELETIALTEDTHRYDAETGEEVPREEFDVMSAKLSELTPSQKIRRAMIGKAADILTLVRDPNRIIASAAARSPALQENTVVRITASRAVSDDVLRIISLDREWTRSYQVKLNLVTNPRTPFAFSAKLVAHLREHDLKTLSRSKNVTGAIAKACKQQLERRNQGK